VLDGEGTFGVDTAVGFPGGCDAFNAAEDAEAVNAAGVDSEDSEEGRIDKVVMSAVVLTTGLANGAGAKAVEFARAATAVAEPLGPTVEFGGAGGSNSELLEKNTAVGRTIVG
jgi:hypothetical protein